MTDHIFYVLSSQYKEYSCHTKKGKIYREWYQVPKWKKKKHNNHWEAQMFLQVLDTLDVLLSVRVPDKDYSVVWCPLRFPHKHDACLVFTSSCL